MESFIPYYAGRQQNASIRVIRVEVQKVEGEEWVASLPKLLGVKPLLAN